jgi:ArsR family metal-binding transcriptional regulator
VGGAQQGEVVTSIVTSTEIVEIMENMQILPCVATSSEVSNIVAQIKQAITDQIQAEYLMRKSEQWNKEQFDPILTLAE